MKGIVKSIIVIVVVAAAVAGSGIFWAVGTVRNYTIVKPQPISKQQAIDMVSNNPDVKVWLALFSGPNHTSPATGGRPVIEVDSESSQGYTIHVYEQLSDHTATFNWYQVNKKNGNVSVATLGV